MPFFFLSMLSVLLMCILGFSLLIIINFFIFLLFLWYCFMICIIFCFLAQITNSEKYCFHYYFFFRAWLFLFSWCRRFWRGRLCLLKLWIFCTLVVDRFLLISFLFIGCSLLRCCGGSSYCSSCLRYLWSGIVYFRQFHSLEVIIHWRNLFMRLTSQEVSWARISFAFGLSEIVQSGVTPHCWFVSENQFVIFLDSIFMKSFVLFAQLNVVQKDLHIVKLLAAILWLFIAFKGEILEHELTHLFLQWLNFDRLWNLNLPSILVSFFDELRNWSLSSIADKILKNYE